MVYSRLRIFIIYVFTIYWPIFCSAQVKTPLIILCDPAADESNEQSLIRLLIYSNQLDIRGICITGKSNTRTGMEVVQNCILAYGEVYSKLIQNENNFPSAEGLLDRIKCGKNFSTVGKGLDTEVSDWIISNIDQVSDNIWICVWDYQRELAQALWKIKNTRDSKSQIEFVRKIRIHALDDKDHYRQWILENFPQIFYVADGSEDIETDTTLKPSCYQGQYLNGNKEVQGVKWIYKNIINHHGPLGSIYPPNGNGVNGMKEYATPSFTGLLDNGLNNPEHPEWGGFGGRFKRVVNNYYVDDKDFYNGEFNQPNTVARWRTYLQNDFNNRLNWSVNAGNKVNHCPIIKVNLYSNKQIIEFNASSNTRINIDASDTFDPEGDILVFSWWFYTDASDYKKEINIKLTRNKKKISFLIPSDAEGKTLHLILEVTDNGTPPLTSFKRIVIHCISR